MATFSIEDLFPKREPEKRKPSHDMKDAFHAVLVCCDNPNIKDLKVYRYYVKEQWQTLFTESFHRFFTNTENFGILCDTFKQGYSVTCTACKEATFSGDYLRARHNLKVHAIECLEKSYAKGITRVCVSCTKLHK